MNPQIPGGPPTAKTPVSVEAINGFFQFAKDELGVKHSSDLTQILVALSEKVHPLVLGEVYRTRAQIRMLAERLLSQQVTDTEKVSKILGFLCSESGSHDYTIYRREARDTLGLNIETPTVERYALIKQIYVDLAAELKLSEPFDPKVELAGQKSCSYSHRRGLIESIAGGSHSFRSEGALTKRQIQVNPQVIQEGIEDQRAFEGWKHETA